MTNTEKHNLEEVENHQDYPIAMMIELKNKLEALKREFGRHTCFEDEKLLSQ